MNQNLTGSVLVFAIGGVLFVGSGVAQTAPAAPAQSAPATSAPAPANPNQVAGAGKTDPGHPRVNQVNGRLSEQQARIANGVKDGQLTTQQAHQLQAKDRAIAHQEKKDMAANGGHLTKQEQKNLNKNLNKNSKKIYNEKH